MMSAAHAQCLCAAGPLAAPPPPRRPPPAMAPPPTRRGGAAAGGARARRCRPPCADPILGGIRTVLDTLEGAAEPGGAAAADRRGGRRRRGGAGAGMGDGVFALLAINFALFAAEHLLHPPWVRLLPLSHAAPRWWQFVTASFVHANWDHLLGNAWSLLVFGRAVEEEEGAAGLWATYLVCGVGGCLASYFSAPGARAVSMGASAAVFGLFSVAVLTKLRPSLRSLLEAVVLGSFVLRQVLGEAAAVAAGKGAAAGGAAVGHWAHLGGALAGVALVVALARLPSSTGAA